ncbi:MAG: serine/threonine-protein kinase, partial [Myxococcota bacterium]|nr:serine/threonine-protein kinase [Myxococcota bacterium]
MQKASQLISKTIHGYELEALLYENGVTALFVAYKEDTWVVIKVGIAKEAGVLMHREAKILASLKHLNIVVLIDQFELNGMPALVLERHARGSLLSHLGAFSGAQIEQHFLSLIDAISYMHKKNITHRDIKPENILLASDGRLVLIDFGLAYFRGEPTYSSLGTPHYSAPEILHGAPPNVWSDLYALTLVMYQLFCESRPPHLLVAECLHDMLKGSKRADIEVPPHFSPRTRSL